MIDQSLEYKGIIAIGIGTSIFQGLRPFGFF